MFDRLREAALIIGILVLSAQSVMYSARVIAHEHAAAESVQRNPR